MPPSVVVVGSYVQDQIFTLPEFPEAGQTLIGDFQTGPGGKGSNQAVAAARTGVSAAFIGATGQDAFAEVASEFHRAEGIDSRLVRKSNNPTGVAGILVNSEGENQIVVALGANNFLTAKDIPDNLIEESQVLIAQLECNLHAVDHALSLGRKHSATTILNPAPMRDDFPLKMLELVDILIPNETEFAHLMRLLFPEEYIAFSETDLLELSANQLHNLCRKLNVPTVIITLGSRGSLISSNESHLEIPPLSGIEVVDTTGAGDAFVGGFASGLVQYEGDIEKSAKLATVVAGLSITKLGTAPAMPNQQEIFAELEK